MASKMLRFCARLHVPNINYILYTFFLNYANLSFAQFAPLHVCVCSTVWVNAAAFQSVLRSDKRYKSVLDL